LALAGIAVAWIFKVGEGSAARLDAPLLVAVFYLVLALAADLLQYIALTLAWGGFHRWKEMRMGDVTKNPEVVAPVWLNWPGLVFFWFKFVFVSVAYFQLATTVWHRWT
jgi:hypothetical protein